MQQNFEQLISQIAKSVHKKRPSQNARPMGKRFCLKGTHIYVVRRDIRLQETWIQFNIPLELVHYAL